MALKIGIIGCGGIAGEHVRGYKACDDVTIAAGSDVDIERAVSVAGREHAYSGFHEMLASEQLDAVSVCTPPKVHKDAVCAALSTGVHVLCEKPLAMNAAEAREMVECARQNKKLLVTAFCHRFHEPVVRARQIIRSGKVGKVTMFRNRFGGLADMTSVWFSNPDVSGGGTVMDTSIHSIDLFRYLVGNPIRVAAAMASADTRYRVEDTSLVIMQTRDGAIGSIEASWTSPGSANVIEVYGTAGAIVIDYFQPGLKFMPAATGAWEQIECAGPDRFVEQARHFVASLRGSEPIVTGEDGLRASEIADAAYAFPRGDGLGWAALER